MRNKKPIPQSKIGLKWWTRRESNSRPQQFQSQVIHRFVWFIPKPAR